MGYYLNKTDHYHKHGIQTLGWELTVCNALYPPNSVCRTVLKSNASFGVHLFNFLKRFIAFPQLKNILEVGGGMGYLMKDFLALSSNLQATMLDISPLLLEKQKETLSGLSVLFREADFLHVPVSELRAFDFIILNENLGDFPTLVADRGHSRHSDPETLRWANKVDDYEEEFSLNFSAGENINIGALSVVEKLCGARIPYIYLSEHSCESSHHNHAFPCLNFQATGNPEKITLKGHNEFTVKFSYLQKIAEQFHYRVVRGQYIDILYLDLNDKVQTALRSPNPINDEQEVIQHFVYDLYKYEYMVLINENKKRG